MAKNLLAPTFWCNPRFLKLKVGLYIVYGESWFMDIYSNRPNLDRHRVDILGTELLKELYGDK